MTNAANINQKETKMAHPIDLVAKPECTGRLTADSGQYAEVLIPGQYGNPDRVVRVCNASHRIIITFDDADSTDVGGEFRACLDPTQPPVPTNRVDLV